MVKYKRLKEILYIKKSSILASKTLGIVSQYMYPGINISFLDKIAKKYILKNKGIPGFLGLYNYPNTLCISINEQIIHGIPNNRLLKNGDIVSIDCGVKINNYYGDVAYTFIIGDVNKNVRRFVNNVKKALYIGIKNCKINKYIGNIGYNIKKYINKFNYGIVKEFVGHGIGKELHESPNILNYDNKDNGIKIKNGLVISIEPMITYGKPDIRINDNNWTISTLDNKISAHFEHNVAIYNNKTIILSTYKYIKR